MDFTQAIAEGFRNYIKFSGRASRSEYWYWTLFCFLVGIVTSCMDSTIPGENKMVTLHGVFVLITFVPNFAIFVRRLHDINRSGWWWLLALTVIGAIPLLIWACMKGTEGENRFGPDPLEEAAPVN